MIYEKIKETIEVAKNTSVPQERKQLLDKLVNYLTDKTAREEEIALNFICTHNSRRSHLSQVWAKTIADYYGFSTIECYSSGTEATSVYPAIINVLQKAGFRVEKTNDKEKTTYQITYNDEEVAISAYSKTIDVVTIGLPFAAVMTCASADENCPYVPGAEQRISLPYEDPKIADGTEREMKLYSERSMQIASEFNYVFQRLTNKYK